MLYALSTYVSNFFMTQYRLISRDNANSNAVKSKNCYVRLFLRMLGMPRVEAATGGLSFYEFCCCE